MTKESLRKIQSFINKCLRRIVGVFWPDTISNVNLWERTSQARIEKELKKRKWRWIGHTLRKSPDDITRRSLTWNPQGKRSRGRPKASWKREVESEMKKAGKSWSVLTRVAQDRRNWRSLIDGLCSPGS